MATYLTDLADVLRKAGLHVVEIPGWKTRGRPGSFAPIGVLCHHTGSADTGLSKEYGYANWLATVGRSDLSAPLAQLALGRGGTYYVLAAGRANHAGRCRLIAGLQPSYAGADYGDGNAQLVGIEAMNSGSEGWSTEQYAAYVRGCAALNAAYGYPVARTLAHRETSLSGKPDPGLINMTTFRSQVAAEDPTITKDWFDMATAQDLANVITSDAVTEIVARRILTGVRTVRNPDDPTGDRVAVSSIIEQGSRASVQALAQVTALSAAVEALATSQGVVDPAVIVATVDKAVRDRLGKIRVDVEDESDPEVPA